MADTAVQTLLLQDTHDDKDEEYYRIKLRLQDKVKSAENVKVIYPEKRKDPLKVFINDYLCFNEPLEGLVVEEPGVCPYERKYSFRHGYYYLRLKLKRKESGSWLDNAYNRSNSRSGSEESDKESNPQIENGVPAIEG